MRDGLKEEKGLPSNTRKYIFPASYRIKKKSDFDRYFQGSRFKAGKYLVIRYIFDPENITRLGLSISKRGRNAIIVNRFKRLAREAFRLHYQELKDNLQLIISYKKQINTDVKYKEIEDDFLRILTTLRLLKPSSET